LNGVVGLEGVGNPMFTVVVSTLSYLHFISYTTTLLPSARLAWTRGG
jgi:hypothetical protein